MGLCFLASFLCVLFTCVMEASSLSNAAEYATNSKMSTYINVAPDHPLSASSVSHHHLRRRLQELESSAESSLKLRMVYRNAHDSPARHEFASKEEEILHVIKMDEMRVKGLYAPLNSSERANGDGALVSPASAPQFTGAGGDEGGDDYTAPALAPQASTGYEDFEARVVSGASFPGNIGQYFVKFSIGTPPQPFFFIADTGSDLVWVPCSLQDAPQVNGSIFAAQSSSTFNPIACTSQECELIPPPAGGASCSARQPTSCKYGYGYSDTSQTTGVFAYDTFTLDTTSSKAAKVNNVAFGCGTRNTGPSITKVGGVIGLGQGPISFTSQVGYMYGNKFSYCFTSFFHTNASSALIFGDDLTGTELKAPMQYTPFLLNPASETFYYVGIELVVIDDITLPILSDMWKIRNDGSGGAVVDSGTTLSFFVQPAYDNITQALMDRIDYPLAPPTAGLPICYNVSGITNPQLPQLSIVFQGDAVFKPSPKNYFLSPQDDLRCLGFMPSAASGGVTVIGNLLQQNFHVEYDRLQNRLGFAKAHCSVP